MDSGFLFMNRIVAEEVENAGERSRKIRADFDSHPLPLAQPIFDFGEGGFIAFILILLRTSCPTTSPPAPPSQPATP
jgi:hypothetical protein